MPLIDCRVSTLSILKASIGLEASFCFHTYMPLKSTPNVVIDEDLKL
jgi:hypothetical protein